MKSIRERIEELKANNKIQDAMLRYDTEPTKEELVASCNALIRDIKEFAEDPEKAERFNDITGKVVRSAAVSVEDLARMAELMGKIKKS